MNYIQTFKISVHAWAHNTHTHTHTQPARMLLDILWWLRKMNVFGNYCSVV